MLITKYEKVIHLIFSFSGVLSWMLFVVDIGLIGFLAWHSYQDGEIIFHPYGTELNAWVASNLDRFEMPFFGGLASAFVDEE